MIKTLSITVMLLFCLLAVAQQAVAPSQAGAPAQTAAPAVPTIPAAAAQQSNPVKPNSESIAQGKKYYAYDCAMCHGANGDGKGDVAADENLKVPDFTDTASLQGKTDGELFYVLKNGKGHMPAEPVRLNQNELWNLINYVRSLSGKK